MLTQMNLLVSKYWKILLSLAFGVVAFLFWWLAYPVMTAYQEQYQLFLFDSDYICHLLSVPDGLARCIGEYFVQFYINHALGALVLAVLLVLIQRITTWIMKSIYTGAANAHYALSFLPSLFLWLILGDESVLLTFSVALLMGLAVMGLFEWLPVRFRAFFIIVIIPCLYWMAGSVVLMTAAYIALRLLQEKPLTRKAVVSAVLVLAYAVGCIVASAWYVPYPLEQLFRGVDYYRFVEVFYTLPAILMAVCALLPLAMRWLPSAKGRQALVIGIAEGVVLIVAFLLLCPLFYDARKYEVMEYDYLVRCKNWSAIIAKAEKKTPDLPSTVCATNLALAMKGQLGDRAFEFYQNGVQGLLPQFERNFSTLLLAGEVYWQLGLVNTAQRYAFEAMEAIPDYSKSCRAVKRLVETNLINGQYDVARKYLQMLEKTVSYRKWAQRTKKLLGDEKAINADPVYGHMRQLRLNDDMLFSEQELDKIIGQLLMQNPKNGMAMQYLLLYPLLERDINKFMNYMTYVDGLKSGYRPRICQEAVAFAFAQRNQQPPQGFVNPLVMNSFSDFARIYSAGSNAAALERFKNTAWYYLMVGR